MQSFLKIAVITSASILLSACAGQPVKVSVSEIEGSRLQLTTPSPLNLRDVEWQIFEHNDTTYYSLDQQNFNALSKNSEDVQNRLFLQHNMINKYKEFYE